jgi:hypothetical protein
VNPIRFALSTALLASLAFSCALVSAQEPTPQNQEPKKHEASPPPREKEAQPGKPEKQEEEKPPKHGETKLPEPQPETKPPKTEKQEVPQPSKEQKKAAHEEHGTSTQQGKARPAGKSAHIPDPQFKAHFGKQHTFAVNRVITTTTIVPNQTQFVFAGYTFIFLDPWPAGWLFTDDCYIDFVEDEYFLIDVFHPGVRVALFVVG